MMKHSFYAWLPLMAFLLPHDLAADNEALTLKAVDHSYVEVPFFSTPAEMTIEAWVKTGQTGTGTIVAWKDVAGDGESSMFRLKDGKLQYGEWYGNYWYEIDSPNVLNNGMWQHVAIVRKGSAATLYVNGTRVATATMASSAACTTDNLKIGALGTTWGECFDGTIDEVRIWSVARTADEIATNYTHELTGNEAHLEGYWRFNGNLADATSHHRDGRANNVGYTASDIFNTDAPAITGLAFAESLTTLPTLRLEASRSGRLYWGVRPAVSKAPTAEELKAGKDMVLSDNAEVVTKGRLNIIVEDTLRRGENYVPYALLVASDGKASDVATGTKFTYEGLSCLPQGWSSKDVGTATAGTSATFADGTFTVVGGGTDVWSTSDGFRFVYTKAAPDVDIKAHVADIKATDNWAKVGLMLRASTSADSRHVFICTTPGEGNNAFGRLNDGDRTSVATLTPARPWLRLVKKGGWVATYVSADGKDWTKVGTSFELLGGQTFDKVGLAVCGHGSGTATARFDHVTISAPADTVNLADRGVYFYKKKYTPAPIPKYADIAAQLPHPVLSDNPEWVTMYNKAWQIGIGHIKAPQAGSPLVSNFYDEAFDSHIFQWDMLFMTIFGRYAAHVFPGVESLDNFYCRQHVSGCITRCLTEDTGEDNGDENSDNIINPPLFAWAEMQNYLFTNDTTRLRQVFPVLVKYDEFVEEKRMGYDTPHKLYWNNGQASGMDNLPRDEGRANAHHASDHQGWVDMSAQMAIQSESLSQMAGILARTEAKADRRKYYTDKAAYYAAKARSIGERMNKWLWNEKEGIYYDVDTLGVQTNWKTAACFWPMLAGVTSAAQDSALVRHLQDPKEFWRPNVFPALAADQKGYSPRGGYWCGGVWAPSNYAIIKGLERQGINTFAHLAAMRYITAVYDVYRQTGTFWENYAPEKTASGRFNHGTDESDYNPCRRDFIGWTGLAPISLLIENVIGLRADAPKNQLVFDLRRLDRHGIEGLHFGGITTSVIAADRKTSDDAVDISVESTKPYRLIVLRDDVCDTLNVVAGKQQFHLAGLTTGLAGVTATASRPAFSYDDATRTLTIERCKGAADVTVYSLDCTRVRRTPFAAGTATSSLSLDDLPAGIYVVNLTTDGRNYAEKIAVR